MDLDAAAAANAAAALGNNDDVEEGVEETEDANA
jgi:hypothetical protein